MAAVPGLALQGLTGSRRRRGTALVRGAYCGAEQQAQGRRQGVWLPPGGITRPWDWRRNRRSPGAVAPSVPPPRSSASPPRPQLQLLIVTGPTQTLRRARGRCPSCTLQLVLSFPPSRPRRQRRIHPRATAHALALEHLDLADKIAGNFARRTFHPFDDLRQLGVIGLLKAADRFDPSSGRPFRPYARTFANGEIPITCGITALPSRCRLPGAICTPAGRSSRCMPVHPPAFRQ
ncbi:sigma-70 family RNA polymerase sigma factor [Synechococcus sp. CBW1002]|uniref:sigma-70 family RNA polymerase sigma factor n=1 Tax=Synechococcus sp. CBW1002 TaxID=1353134 RepID=UPI001E5BE8A8|nr:sigma factor [Synechococcus sp. CBW1002]